MIQSNLYTIALYIELFLICHDDSTGWQEINQLSNNCWWYLSSSIRIRFMLYQTVFGF